MYITEANARARLKENFDKFYDLAARPDDFADDVSKAENTVNSYAGKRYVVPPSGAALSMLTQLSLDLLERYAYKRSGAGSTIPEKIQDAHDDAIKILADYSTGKAVLIGGTFTSSPGNMGSAIAVVEGDDAVFTKTRLNGL